MEDWNIVCSYGSHVDLRCTTAHLTVCYVAILRIFLSLRRENKLLGKRRNADVCPVQLLINFHEMWLEHCDGGPETDTF
jgi:hypothetical protein